MKLSEYADARYDIRPIVGIEQPTAQSAQRDGNKVKLLRRLGKDDLAGDGTVPRPSATPTEFDRLQNAIYASERHASLQNDGDVLFQLNGILTQPSFNPSDYRDATSKIGQSLDVEDWLTPDQPLEVRASTPIPVGCSSQSPRTPRRVRKEPSAAPAHRRRLVHGDARPAAGGLVPGLLARGERGAGDGSRHGRRRVAHGELGCSHRYRPVLVGRSPPVEPSATRSRCGNARRPDWRQRAAREHPARALPDHSPEVDEGSRRRSPRRRTSSSRSTTSWT